MRPVRFSRDAHAHRLCLAGMAGPRGVYTDVAATAPRAGPVRPDPGFRDRTCPTLRPGRRGEDAGRRRPGSDGDHFREADVEYDQPIGSNLIEQVVEQWRSWFSNITFRQRAA